MDKRQLTERLCVSPQIGLSDVDVIAEHGFKTVICNRPDGEEAGQTEFSAIEAALLAKGLKAIYMPVTSQTMGPEAAKQFRELMSDNQEPVLAYCRTGTRCTFLWSIGELLSGRPAQEVIDTASNAGYDVSALAANFKPS